LAALGGLSCLVSAATAGAWPLIFRIMETLNKSNVEVTTKIELKNLKIRVVKIPIVGTSPLIVHNFSEKSRHEIEAKQQGKSKASKHDIRIPEEEYQAAKHISIDGWDGFPAGGFKKCLVRGAKAVGLVMKDVQASVFIEPDCVKSNLVKINGESQMRTDMVRIGMGSADVRYRPEYPEWEAELTISFNEGLVSLDQIFQMTYAAGYGVGIGDWRPERSGNYGRFTLKDM